MRRLRMISLAALLLALVLYGKRHDPAVTLAMCLDEPERFDGRQVEIGRETTLVQSWPDSFRVRQMGFTAVIHGDAAAARPGEYLHFLAKFTAPDRFELVRLYVASGRRSKIAWSLLPVLLFGLMWLRRYRFSTSGFCWLERH